MTTPYAGAVLIDGEEIGLLHYERTCENSEMMLETSDV